MNTKLILRTLISPFTGMYADITKDSILARADVDNNFIYLKGETIYSASTLSNTVTLNKLNGNNITFDLPLSAGTITNVENIGNGIGVFNSLTSGGTVIQLNSITGTSNARIAVNVSASAGTINLDVNEQNLILWPLVVNGNQLLSGGASYLSGLTFNVTDLSYIIDDTFYSATSSTVIVASGDSVYDRIDVIIADISGNTSVVQGTPSANPVKPDIDESTQIEVTFVTIAAGVTSIALSSTLVYNEKVGPPAEWVFATPSSPFISGDSTTQTYSGTSSIELSAATNGKSFTLSSSTVFDSTTQNTIQFAIKNRIAWPAGTRIRLSILSSTGIPIGTIVDLYNGRFGFSSSNTTSWQLISIPLSNFTLTTTLFSTIKFLTVNTATLSISCFIDYVRMMEGLPVTTPNPTWFNIRANNGSSIPALTANDTLTISGTSGIGTQVIAPRTLLLTYTGTSGFSGWTGSTGIQSIKANNDTANLASGQYSYAEGSNTTASGLASHAEGGSTSSSNNYSHAEGVFTIASGGGSHSEGGNTTSSGTYSHAEGIFTTASNTGSHSEGNYTTASGIYSHAECDRTKATGNASHAEGYLTTASATGSHAEGGLTIASGGHSHAEGESSQASGPHAHAEGRNTIASGAYSHSQGNETIASGWGSNAQNSGTTASGLASHAEGAYTIASGTTSHAEGSGTTAGGLVSHAEGYLTIAIGDYSHAEGFNTTASGVVSHVEGAATIASGDYSHAGGITTIASGNHSFVHGSASTATGIGTIVLGDGITGTLNNVLYTPSNIDVNGGRLYSGGQVDLNNKFWAASSSQPIIGGSRNLVIGNNDTGTFTLNNNFNNLIGSFKSILLDSGQRNSFFGSYNDILVTSGNNNIGINSDFNSNMSNALAIGGVAAGSNTVSIGSTSYYYQDWYLGLGKNATFAFGNTNMNWYATSVSEGDVDKAATIPIWRLNASRATGSGTSGDIRFAIAKSNTTGSNWNGMTDELTIKGGSGKIGIGTVSPTAKLSISGIGVDYSTSALDIYSSANTKMYNFTDKGRSYHYDTTGTYFLSLEAQGTTGVAEIITNKSSLYLSTAAGEYQFKNTVGGRVLLLSNGQRFDFSATVGGAPNMSLSATDGYLGINTQTPSTPLHVRMNNFGDIVTISPSGGTGGVYVASDINNNPRIYAQDSTSQTAYNLRTVDNCYFTNSISIGVDSSSMKLSVKSNSGGDFVAFTSSASTGGIYFNNSNDNNPYIYGQNNSYGTVFSIKTSGNTFFNGGNVGVGTSAPNTKLHVMATLNDGIKTESIQSGHSVLISPGNGSFGPNITSTYALEFKSPSAELRLGRTSGNGNALIYVDSTVTTGLNISANSGGSANLTLLSDGTVGFGTATPTSSIDINASGSTQFRLRQSYTPTSSGDTSGNVGQIAWDNNYMYVKTNLGWGRAALDYGF